jgi:hypothetical protein
MIASPALVAWLADRDAHKRSIASVESFARHWSQQPLMTEMARQLAALPERDTAGVVEVARTFMRKDAEMALMIEALIASSAGDPFFRPPFGPVSSEIQTGLLLFHHPDMSISLSTVSVDALAAKKSGPRGATSINFGGVPTLYRFVKAGDATISIWEAPPITDDFVASRAGRCRPVERRRLEDGEELFIDGRYQGFNIEHAASDMVYFSALIRPGSAPLAVEYDSMTLAFVGASSTDEASSRVQMMVSMLRTMDREDALPLIEESLETPHFYARWHIMRELLAMDSDAALPALRRMATGDPHPEVRAAAQQTLELFFEDEAEPAGGDVQCRA